MGQLDFLKPNTLEEAKALIRENPKSKLLAGGTDLVLELRRNKGNYNCIVSLDKISELKSIVECEDNIIIGSMVTFNDLIESSVIRNNYNSLLNCSRTMGSPQIRNVATVGGNIVNAGSAADVIPCIISLGGVLIIESSEGIRRVSCENYFKNYHDEKLEDKEILTKIILPKDNYQSGYYKLGKRNSLAIARISAAITLQREENRIKNIKICLGAVGRYPLRVMELEKKGVNREVQWLFSEEALKYLKYAVEKSIAGRKTMPFKREAIKGVFKEALTIALKS
ncbi:FAD binding domain-containing protein [Clostridium sp.]|uniref:FAD binding domain-containing protein n=1 Tax=Clostridium sp. TaxID=1506 RepID=UPI003217C6F3